MKMKKLILIFCVGVIGTLSAQQNKTSTCEADFDAQKIQVIPSTAKWGEEQNSYKHVKITAKYIEYRSAGKSYTNTEKLYRYEKYNYYGINMPSGEVFYDNYNDAIRALYIIKNCGVAPEKGKVMVN